MKKIIEYNVVESHSIFSLNIIVNKLIKKDWQPFGGVCYQKTLDWNYIQAMVRYSDDHGKYAQGCSTGPL